MVEAQDLVEGLTDADGEVAFVLRGDTVRGQLDLKHRKVEVAVEIRDCEFLDDVDFRYCDFVQAVDLSGCTFRGALNSGDEVESHAVYRKDLVCNSATFEGAVGFNGCRVGGSAYFSGAVFGSREKLADFGAFSVEKTFECEGSTFQGPASFASLKCGGTGFFAGCSFEGPEPVLFSSANFGNHFVCDSAVFAGPVDMERLKCGGGAFFRGAWFLGEGGVGFVQAYVGSSFECQGATFRGPVVLNSVKCESRGSFRGAVFWGPAEFGFASFGGVFDCPGAFFGELANFESLECAALDCNDVDFRGPTNFNVLRCRGSGHFEGSRFRDEVYGATFGYASFGQNVVCNETTFEGPAAFVSMECGRNAFFHGAKFESAVGVSFKHAYVGGNLESQGMVCDGPIDFESLRCQGHLALKRPRLGEANFAFASIRQTLACIDGRILGDAVFDRLECRNLNCLGTTFGGEAQLNSLSCADGGAFNGARFYGPTRFGHASFGVSLSCDGVRFRAKTDFDSLSCGAGAFFRGAEFLEDADFRHASLGKSLDCRSAVFYGVAAFHEVDCGVGGFFGGAKFFGCEREVSWAGASFRGNLECAGAIFNGAVSLNRTNCEGTATFEGARFMSRQLNRFEFAHFGRNLSLRGATFSGPVDLTMTRVSRRLDVSAARFGREVCLYGARVGVLALEGEPFPFDGKNLNLREFGLEGFLGNKQSAKAFDEAQDRTEFSRDPYLQLERYYGGTGDEAEAKTVHYRGKRDLRENAKNDRGATEWSFWTRLGDFFLKYLTGYGTRSWLLLGYIVLFVVLGTWVFWPDSAVAPRAPAPSQPAAAVTLAEGAQQSVYGAGQAARETLRKPLEPFAYSLDLFLPLVNLRYDERWVPVGQLRATYALLHAMAGWFLVPLLVLSFSGIVRRQ